MIVDSHCHVSDIWYEPAETLLFQMDRNGVDKAVLIQVLGQFDNRYQQACLRRWPGRFASVVAVDVASPDALADLQALAGEGAGGLRLRPDARSPGDDPLGLWRAAAGLGLPISCAGAVASVTDAAFGELLTELSGLTVVLEHLGGLGRPDAGDLTAALPAVLDLARFPNLRIKLPGLGQLAQRRPRLTASEPSLATDPSAMILAIIERFGAERVMWGSDFPPVAAREGYANALQWLTNGPLCALSEQDRARALGESAMIVFKMADIP